MAVALIFVLPFYNELVKWYLCLFYFTVDNFQFIRWKIIFLERNQRLYDSQFENNRFSTSSRCTDYNMLVWWRQWYHSEVENHWLWSKNLLECITSSNTADWIWLNRQIFWKIARYSLGISLKSFNAAILCVMTCYDKCYAFTDVKVYRWMQNARWPNGK